MAKNDFQSGRFGRFMSLGSLSGLIGASYLGHRVKSVLTSTEKSAEDLRQKNIRNAERIVETFGRLKGAVMKVGQMMSLQAGVFPDEFTSILSSLQQDSPAVPFEIIEKQIETELEAPLNKLFKRFDVQAYASASIGQVHRAALPDGTEVVVKVQYPGVADMVESDLKNLRMVFRSMASYKLNMDPLILWNEIRERLDEEVNYEQELQNILDFRDFFRHKPKLIIPEPIPEYSTKHVLTLEYVKGLSWQEIIADSFPAETRNKLVQLLFQSLLWQLFDFRTLHADPNLANFGFRQDGSLVLYDFGCVKRFSQKFSSHYKQMIIEALNGNLDQVMTQAKLLGFSWEPESALDENFVRQCLDIVLRPLTIDQTFDFGESTLHLELFDLIKERFHDQIKFTVPPDIIFLNRVIGGMYGNVMKLRASGNWKQLLHACLEPNKI